MNKLISFQTLLLLLLLPLSLLAQGRDLRGKVVGNIQVIIHHAGAEETNTRSLVNRLQTKVGEPFSQLDFDEDLKLLSEEYDRIEPAVDLYGDEVRITLDLWPRPTISEIVWVGNQKIRKKSLDRALGIRAGTPFDRHEFNAAFNKVKALFIKKGYFEARLTYKAIPLPETNEVEIRVDIEEGRSGHIRKIRFKGFTPKEELEVLKLIQTQKYSFIASWATGHGHYQEEAVEQDRFIVLNYLHNLGYADARVQMEMADLPNQTRNQLIRDKGITVTFIADKGPLYRFGKISFYGECLLIKEEDLRRLSIAKENAIFSPEALRDTLKVITDAYGAKGYIDAIVDYELHLVPNAAVYDLDFTVKACEQYRVGVVRVFGNTRTEQRVILNETSIIPGEVFDIRRLQHTEELLRNLGYFDCVNVYAVKPRGPLVPDESLEVAKYRDVYIEVKECSTGTIGLQMGFSTQDNAYIGFELAENNFNYRGIPNIFRNGPQSLRGGGERAKLNINFGKKQTATILSWSKPYFNDTRWAIGFDIERTTSKRQSRDYQIDGLGFKANALYPLNPYVTFGYHYRLKYNNVKLFKPPSELPAKLVLEAQSHGAVSAVGASVVYDSVDFCHTRGLYSLLETEYAGVLGDFKFLRASYLNHYYHPLFKIGTLKFKAEFRLIQPIWDQEASLIPLGERFFLGGETTVRGYAPYAVGPKVYGEPLGGLTSVLFSVELNRRFTRALDGFIFFDAGYVALRPFEVLPLRCSVGAGIRLRVIGQVPMTFGFGVPLNPERKSDGQPFFFSMGGHF